ncbi:cilium assembly protein DZIP1 isoform 2-T2 [Discoglossus pictus]
MPFYENVYYPYAPETAPSSPSLPVFPWVPRPSSLLNNMPSHGPVFKFRERHESVDWRRIGAIDVDRVANELDFVTLQDNIMGITFCNVENEKCPHCHSSLDPVLLKLFQLAQFTIEYLLHSQEFLTSNLQALEEKVQATQSETEETNLKLTKQYEVVKALKEECKRRKMVIATQQIMLNSNASPYHKCHHCDKAFMNYAFLQSHMRRRHPEAASSEKHTLQASEKLQQEISELKEELQLTKCQLEAEQCAQMERLSKFQELEQRHSIEQDILKKFDHWKQEEQMKVSEEMRKVKEMFMKEFEEVTKKNASLERELKELKKDNQKLKSGLGTLQDSPKSVKKEVTHKCPHDMKKLKELLEMQEDKWASRIHLIRQEHDTEKNQLLSQIEKLRLSMCEDQKSSNDFYKKRLDDLGNKLQEQNELIKAQKDQIKELSTKTKPEVKKYSVPVSVHVRDMQPKPNVVLSRDLDTDQSPNTSKQLLISALKKNPTLTKELRIVLEQGLTEKLEAFGIKPGVRGITNDRMNRILGSVASSRGEKEKLIPEIQLIRDNLSRHVSYKAEKRAKSSPHTDVKLLPIQSTTAKSKPPVLKWPPDELKPDRRHTHPLKSSTPKTKSVSPKDTSATKASSVTTSPFTSSDDESEDDILLPSYKAIESFEQNHLLIRRDGFVATESESEGSLLEEFDRNMLNMNSSNTPTPPKPLRSTTMVKEIAGKIEKQLSSRTAENKPAGGVDVAQPESKVTKDPVMEMRVSDIEDNDFDSTSFEEETQSVYGDRETSKYKTKPSAAPAKNASSLTKLTKGDPREADTSSTLVSSLVTVSDFSDSDI